MERGSLARTSLAVVLGLGAWVHAPVAHAHSLVAQGALVCSYPPCADTHLEGHYTNGGVPGVNLDYSFFNTMVDSDNGGLSIDAGLSWFEGTSRPGANFELIDAGIAENGVLTRLAPGPVTARATLLFAPAAQIAGPGHSAVTVTANLSFDGCDVTAHQTFSIAGAGAIEVTGSVCGGELHGRALVVTRTYDDALPASSQLSASLVSDYLSIQKNSSISVQTGSDLHFELSNATADWDTPTFLTLAPEPEDDALGVVAIGLIACCGTHRRRSIRNGGYGGTRSWRASGW